jgi:hypothetical protein
MVLVPLRRRLEDRELYKKFVAKLPPSPELDTTSYNKTVRL